jgi:GTPase-activating protein SST2
MALSHSTSISTSTSTQNLDSTPIPTLAAQEATVRIPPSAGPGPTITPNSPSSSSLTSPNRLVNNYKHRQSAPSTASSKQSRAGLLNFAALAREKTSSAIASFSEPALRNRPSSNSLYRSAQSSPTSTSPSPITPSRSAEPQASPQETSESSSLNSTSTAPSSQTSADTASASSGQRQSLLETNPPSQAYSNTATDTPTPITFLPSANYNKMHQTSSRLLRMTSDDRPFTRVGANGTLDRSVCKADI